MTIKPGKKCRLILCDQLKLYDIDCEIETNLQNSTVAKFRQCGTIS